MITPEAILDTLDGLDPLCDLPRTGWLLRGISPCESIAAHSHAVALLVGMLVDACRAEGMTVDGEAALRMALVHDAPEARLGDVPMPVKSPALDAALHVVEEQLAASLLPPAWHAAWVAAEAGESLESRLVKAADKLQMLHKLSVYERAGRRHPQVAIPSPSAGLVRDGGSGALPPTSTDFMWSNPANLRGLDLPPVRRLYEAIFARAGRPMPTVPPSPR